MRQCSVIGCILLSLAVLSPPCANADESPAAAFHRGYFLQSHVHDYAAAAAAFEAVVADAGAPAALRQQAKTRLAECREELVTEDLARLMPPEAVAYVEITRPGEHLERLLTAVGLAGKPRTPVGGKPGGVRLNEVLFLPDDFTVSPALIDALKKVRGAAWCVTRVIPEQHIVEGVHVLHPGDDDLVRGQIETAVQLLEPAEPIEGFRVHQVAGKVWIALTQRLMLVAGNREDLAATINRVKDPKAESLACREDFQRCRADARNSLLFAYVGGQEALREFGARLSGEEAAIARAVLDLDHLESLTAVAGATEDGIHIETRLNLAPGHNNLAYSLVRTAPLTKRSLKYVPRGILGVALLGLNPAGDPAAAARTGAVQPISVMDIGREVFGNIEEIAVFALPPAGGAPGRPPLPEVAAVIAVNDASKSEALWNQLLAMPAMFGIEHVPPPQDVSIEGVKGKVYVLPEAPPIAVVRLDDRALVAGTMAAVTAAVKTPSAGQSITEDESFRPLLDRLGPHASKAVLVDAARVVQAAASGAPPRHASQLTAVGAILKELKVSAVTLEGPEQLAVSVDVTGLPNALAILRTALQAQSQHRSFTSSSSPADLQATRAVKTKAAVVELE